MRPGERKPTPDELQRTFTSGDLRDLDRSPEVYHVSKTVLFPMTRPRLNLESLQRPRR